MKKIFKFAAAAFTGLALLGLAASCDIFPTDEEDLSTDQYSAREVMFSAFAPNPVYRGGEITVKGSFLEQIKEIQVPGVPPITNFTVTQPGDHGELTFTVPVDGPEVGLITLVTKDGRQLVSMSELTYTEPIVFTSFTPETGLPGTEVTITGDYLNLVQEVIFNDGAIVGVQDFVSQSRYTLKVLIPDHAITGKIAVGDVDQTVEPDAVPNKVASAKEIVIGDPTVENLGDVTFKAGNEIVITGKDLGMIQKVTIGGVDAEFSVDTYDKTHLTVILPSNAPDGDIVLTSFAGKTFNAGNVTTVVPERLVAAPQPVKADKELTITGINLDLVTGVDFPGANGAEFTFADDVITVNVPVTAAEGDIVLNMENGKSVSVAYTLVHPTVTSVSPAELKAGESIIVKGTDLDLVASATLGGKDVEFAFANDGSELTIKTTNTSNSGKIVLTLANKEKIEPEQTITLSYDSLIIITEMPASEHIGKVVTLKGQNFLMIENIFIGQAKVTGYLLRTDTEIQFVMPYNKIGTYPVYFDLLSGERETCPNSIEVQLEQNITVIWEGEEDMGSWSNQPYLGEDGQFITAGLKVGDKIRFYYAPKGDQFQIQLFDGHWGALSIAELGGGQTISQETVPNYTGYFEFVVTPALHSQLASKMDWGGAMLCQGENAVVTMITMVHDIPQEVTIWEGEAYDNWTNTCLGAEDDFLNAGLYVGAEIRIYFTPDKPDDYQVQTFTGHWGGLAVAPDGTNQFNNKNQPDAITKGYCYFTVTDEILASLTEKQGWGNAIILQANGATFTKVTFF